MKNKKLILFASVLGLSSLFFALVKTYKNRQAQDLELKIKTNLSKLAPAYSPRIGSSNAPVQIVEFLDPECESCRDFYPLLKMLLKEFEGKVELVIRYAPFHSNSKLVIKILEASRKQGKYWETLDVLFRYQPQWGSHHNPRPDLIWNFLPEANINVEKLKNDMLDPALGPLIEREVQAYKDFDVKLTPTFFVNGRQLHIFSYDALRQLVEQELLKVLNSK